MPHQLSSIEYYSQNLKIKFIYKVSLFEFNFSLNMLMEIILSPIFCLKIQNNEFHFILSLHVYRIDLTFIQQFIDIYFPCNTALDLS